MNLKSGGLATKHVGGNVSAENVVASGVESTTQLGTVTTGVANTVRRSINGSASGVVQLDEGVTSPIRRLEENLRKDEVPASELGVGNPREGCQSEKALEKHDVIITVRFKARGNASIKQETQ